jgi:hypothetical protein
MEITTTTLGFVGLAAVAVTAIILAVVRPRQRGATNRFVGRSASAARRRSWRSTNWYASDPVLFVGGDAASADCSAGADGGGGSCA